MNEFIARNGIISQNSSVITGSLIVTEIISGSLFGTSSYSTQALNATNADNTTNLNGRPSNDFVLNSATSSFVTQTESTGSLATKSNIDSPTFTGTVSGITKTMVGLENIDNTTDADKPVSAAGQTALNFKANIASPTFTGAVTSPSFVGTLTGNATTATSASYALNSINAINADTVDGNHASAFVLNSSTGSFATETYVNTAVSNLVDSSPTTLNTLNELAAALGDDPNFATTVTTSIGTKQPQLSGTGFVKASGTTISYDNSTYVPTSRTITINGTALDLSANRSFTTTSGTVTSVGGTGTVNGLTLTGTLTTSGSLTLGGTLGSIANSQLTNSSITVGSTAISLGSSATTIAGLSSVTSTTFVGALTGNATTATNLSSILTTFSGTYPLTVNVTGTIYSNSNITYNGTTQTLTAPNFAGALTGNATTATSASILTTARTINGVSFNGSANITVADSTKLPLAGGTMTGGIYMGPFPSSVVNSGNAIIGKGSDRTNGNMTVQLGNLTSTVFEVVDKDWTSVIFSAGMNSFSYKASNILHADNYNSYSPTLNGTGSVGTWPISITGNAGSVAWNNVTSKPGSIFYYQGFTLNGDTMDTNASGFTYSDNAPFTGPIMRIGNAGYSLQLNASYGGGGNQIAFRTRNGDAGTFNPWRTLLSTGNYNSYSPTLNGTGSVGTWPISITGNAGSLGGVAADNYIFGDGANGRSKDKSSQSADTSDESNSSGFYFGNSTTGMPDTNWWNWLTVAGNSWAGSDGYRWQIAGSFWSDDWRLRRQTSGGWNGWVSLLHSGNYNSYALPLGGGTLTGDLTISKSPAALNIICPSGGSATINLTSNSTGGGDAIINTTTASGSAGDLVLKAAGTTGIRIKASGKVGIGTTGPTTSLHVENSSYGTISADVRATIYANNTAPNTSYANSVGIYAKTLGASSYSVYGENTSTGYGGFFVGKGYFSGNVGIGTTAQSSKLHLVGDSLTMGSVFTNQAAPSTASTGATVTGIMLLAGIIQNTGSGWGLPTAASINLAFFPALSSYADPVRGSFDWSVINTNTSQCSLSPSTGHTLVGNVVVAASSSARYRTVKTGISTYVTYRIS